MKTQNKIMQAKVANKQAALAKKQSPEQKTKAREPVKIDDYIKHLLNLGAQHYNNNDITQAMFYFEQAVNRDPKFFFSHYLIGRAFLKLNQLVNAEKFLVQAIKLNSKHTETLVSLASLYRRNGRPEHCLKISQQIIATQPANYDIKIEMAQYHRSLRQYDDAINILYDILNNSEYNVHIDIAYCRLSKGDFSLDTWELYEQRWLLKEAGIKRHQKIAEFTKDLLVSRNNNSKTKNKTLLLWSEQGFGDTILFARFIACLKNKLPNLRIILECQDPLKSLLKNCPGTDLVISRTDLLPDNIDYQIPLLSLGCLLELTKKDFTGQSYLSVDEKSAPILPCSLTRKTPKQKIGLIWSVSNTAMGNQHRNVQFTALKPLLLNNNVDFYSLQKGPGRSDLVLPHLRHEVIDLGSWIKDFHDTAVLMQQMDLIITVDTAAAHLAGALGVECWLMLPYESDWRWDMERDHSPCYDSIKIYRQSKMNNWSDVIKQITQDLLAKEENDALLKSKTSG